jgi:hypothetical protein
VCLQRLSRCSDWSLEMTLAAISGDGIYSALAVPRNGAVILEHKLPYEL